jgi:VanZ family protein
MARVLRPSRAVSVWLPVLAWAAIIFAFSSVPSLSSGLGGWDYLLRKAAHMTEYAILVVLLWRALGSELPALAASVVYAISDEIHQAFVRGRHGSPIDVGIDTVGMLIGLLVLRRMRSRGEGGAAARGRA